MKSNKLLALLVSSLITLPIVSCKNKDNEFIYVGVQVYDPVYVAMDKGWFADEGVDFKLYDTTAGAGTATQLLASGKANGALVNYFTLSSTKSNGIDGIKGVVDCQTSFEDTPLLEWFVRKDSGIKTVEDLKGKKIGINMQGNSFYYYVEKMFKDHNIELEKDCDVSIIAFGQMYEALKTKKVDIIGLMQPYTYQARNDDTMEKLFDGTDVFGNIQSCPIIANTKTTSRETLEKVVTVIARTEDWIMENKKEADKIIAKYTGLDESKFEDYTFTEHGKINIDDANTLLKYMQDNHGISKTIVASDIATNEYNLLMK